MIKIIIAKYSGFCSGVERSTNLVKNKNYKKPIYTWGPLIHNNEFTNYLKKQNIFSISSIKNVKSGTIITRSHGITKNEFLTLKKSKLNIIDGTCPNVIKVQKLAQILENNKFQIIILGDKKHPEVIGITSYLKKPIVISSIKEIKNIKMSNNLALISQTTQSVELFKKIAQVLKKNNKKIKIFNTICSATYLRQNSAKITAKKSDIMIIVGGKHSSNTQKLFNLCNKITKSYHIETYKDLKKSYFKNVKIAGLTAGASTPKWEIKKIINYIKKIKI